MFKTRLFKHFFVLLLAVAILNFLASTFYLYWTFWWFDMMVHFLAGGVVAMVVILILDSKGSTLEIPKVEPWYTKIKMIFWSVAGALLVGIIWEIYEVHFGITFLSDGIAYVRDTSSDIIMDICGGFFGSLYAHKMINK